MKYNASNKTRSDIYLSHGPDVMSAKRVCPHTLLICAKMKRTQTRLMITVCDEEDPTTSLVASPQTLPPPIGELNTEQAHPTSTSGR